MEGYTEKTPEKLITKQDVIDAYRKCLKDGIKNPDDLDLNDPGVDAANTLFEQWMAQEDSRAEGNETAERRVNLERTMFYVDLGSNDPRYLEEILGWLTEDASSIEKSVDVENIKLRKDMADAIEKVRGMLGQ